MKFIDIHCHIDMYGDKVAEVVKKAKEKNCGRMELCVLSWNEPAIKFYEKNGMECLDWKFYRLNGQQIKKASQK